MASTAPLSRPSAVPRWAIEVLLSVGAGITSALFAWFAFGLTPSAMGQRWGIGGADQILHYGIFTSASQVFPFVPNSALGFPEAQNLFFAPLLDLWSSLFVWVSSALGLDGVSILNWYNLLGFFITGATSYLFFRALRVRPVPSLLWAVAFATLPHHFMQLAMGHPFIGNYWAVPLIGILVIMITARPGSDIESWISRGSTPGRVLIRRTVPIVVLSLLVGLGQSYYFVFGLIILGGVWLFSSISALLQGQPLRERLWPTATLVTLTGVVGIQLAILSLNFGDRYEKYFSSRTVAESELYGGKIVQLLLPWDGTGIPLLGSLARAYRRGSPLIPTSESPSTSVIAVLAIVVSMGIILALLASGGSWKFKRFVTLGKVLSEPLTNVMLFGFLWSLLFFVVSGLGPVFAYVVSPEIRAWSRMSIVVYLFSMAVLAILTDRLLRVRWQRWVAAGLLVALIAVDHGLGARNTTPANPTADQPVRDLAAAIDASFESGCGIIQLPLKGFPESGAIGTMGDYDHFMPYMYSSGGLRWSYGAVRGTLSGDYWAGVNTRNEFATAAHESDACAVLVDTYAYVDTPEKWFSWLEAVGADPSEPAIESEGGRYLLFDLR